MNDPIVEENTSAACALAVSIERDVKLGELKLCEITQKRLDRWIRSCEELDKAIEEIRKRNK